MPDPAWRVGGWTRARDWEQNGPFPSHVARCSRCGASAFLVSVPLQLLLTWRFFFFFVCADGGSAHSIHKILKQNVFFLFLLAKSTSTVLTYLSHDRHRARQRHKAHAITQARAGVLMADHPACVISRVGPGQHPQYTRAHYVGEAVGGSTALSTPQFLQHVSGAAVLVAVEQERPASVCNSVCTCDAGNVAGE